MNAILNSFGEILNCNTARCIRANKHTKLFLQSGLTSFTENIYPKTDNDIHELDYLSKYDRCNSCISGKLKKLM